MAYIAKWLFKHKYGIISIPYPKVQSYLENINKNGCLVATTYEYIYLYSPSQEPNRPEQTLGVIRRDQGYTAWITASAEELSTELNQLGRTRLLKNSIRYSYRRNYRVTKLNEETFLFSLCRQLKKP